MEGIEQAKSKRQLINHVAHLGVVFLVAVPFLAGFKLPGWAQFLVAIIAVFALKEIIELGRRWARERALHLADSLLDMAVVIIGAIVALFVSPLAAAIIGGVFLAGYIVLRRRVA